MKELKYTYIDFTALKILDISINEYILCDIICKLQGMNGYCYASNEYFAKCLNITDRGVIKIMKRMIDKGLILVVEKNRGKTNKLCVADAWHNTVIFTSEQSSPTPEQSSLGYEQSSHNNNINNEINKYKIKPVAKAKAKKIILKNDSSDINSLIMYFYSKLIPAEQTDRRFSAANRIAMDSLLSTYNISEIRATIDKAKELLGKPYKPQVQSIQSLLAKYEQIKADKQIIKHQPTKSF